ncbi:MAG TPA: aldehyde dehydrogenase family protein [Microbacteriaceae bacterium]|nr:aldehyde dehydrogenase family protein [Microbacteriaceae bacterium]
MTLELGRAALVLVDMQADYLDVSNLEPARARAINRASALLETCREAQLPIVHVHTEVAPDGRDAMPHRRAQPKCVAGTPGAGTPIELEPRPHEHRTTKQFYSPFGNPEFASWLIHHRIDTVIVAGAYTHACVRQTAIDCYERGLRVVVVPEACATNRPEHAAESLAWMSERFVTLASIAELASELPNAANSVAPSAVERALASAVAAQSTWAARPLDERIAFLASWRTVINEHRDAIAEAIVRDVRKPIRFARDEVRRALAHIDSAIDSCAPALREPEIIAPGIEAHRAPLGTVGLIMPWNNPIALPVGNIAPALLCGNAVVLKPSPFAPQSTAALIAALRDAGLPEGVVMLAPADVPASRALTRHPDIRAIAFTGSIPAGRDIARTCAERLVPLRAELGGNNAAIIWGVDDATALYRALVHNGFGFAGQRCTAIRRVIVPRAEQSSILAGLKSALADLAVGAPEDEDTVCGPLVSEAAAQRVRVELSAATARGVRVEQLSTHPNEGRWIPPTIAVAGDPLDPLVQRETFGPVLVIQTADSIDEAIELANGVEQGLLISVCSDDRSIVDRVTAAASVGIVQSGAASVPVHPDAPFGGWKASGFGGAEHGRWDVDFYTRLQARYLL